MYLTHFIVLPALIMVASYFLLIMNLSISPFLFIAFAVIPAIVGSKFNHRLGEYESSISKTTAVFLFIIIPLLFMSLLVVLDGVVYLLIETSPIHMLTELLHVNYFPIESLRLLPANEDNIFLLFFSMVQYLIVILSFFGVSIYYHVDTERERKSKEEDEASPQLKTIKTIIATNAIGQRSHNHRSNMTSQGLSPKLWLVILMGVGIYVLIPTTVMVLLALSVSKGYDLLMFATIIIGVILYKYVTKQLIMQMNGYSAWFRFLGFILVPGAFVAILVLVGTELGLIQALGSFLDNAFETMLQLPADHEPLESGEFFQYTFAFFYGFMTLIGLYAFSVRCSVCGFWYDPYAVVSSSGVLGTYQHQTKTYRKTATVREIHDSGQIDVDVELEHTKTENEHYTVEIHHYRCIKCKTHESRKLTSKVI
jgi:ABC-type multidrug transport system fused ATPase/permease subunit